jgi:hypothetical protein
MFLFTLNKWDRCNATGKDKFFELEAKGMFTTDVVEKSIMGGSVVVDEGGEDVYIESRSRMFKDEEQGGEEDDMPLCGESVDESKGGSYEGSPTLTLTIEV